jgi:hypothetical protein
VLRGRVGEDNVRPGRAPFEQRTSFRVESVEIPRAQPGTGGQCIQGRERSPQLRVDCGDDGAHRVLGRLDLLAFLRLRVVEQCGERQQYQGQQSNDDDPEQPPLERTERNSAPYPFDRAGRNRRDCSVVHRRVL